MKQATRRSMVHVVSLMLFIISSYSHASQKQPATIPHECAGKLNKKQEITADWPPSQKLQTFLKDHAYTIISLACAIAGLYMTYYYSNEGLKLSRASFIIDKGEAAMKNLSMVAEGKFAQYKALVEKAKVARVA